MFYITYYIVYFNPTLLYTFKIDWSMNWRDIFFSFMYIRLLFINTLFCFYFFILISSHRDWTRWITHPHIIDLCIVVRVTRYLIRIIWGSIKLYIHTVAVLIATSIIQHVPDQVHFTCSCQYIHIFMFIIERKDFVIYYAWNLKWLEKDGYEMRVSLSISACNHEIFKLCNSGEFA